MKRHMPFVTSELGAHRRTCAVRMGAFAATVLISLSFASGGGLDRYEAATTPVQPGRPAVAASMTPSSFRGSPGLGFATFLGGPLSERLNAIATDRDGNVLVVGTTSIIRSGFPPPPSHALIAKYSPAGALLWQRSLGGSGVDEATAVAADSSGDLLVTGYTTSPDFPASGGLQPIFGGEIDAFVARLSSSGDLLHATYLGGARADQAAAIAIDPDGNVVVAGETISTDFPLLNPVQSSFGGGDGDAFVAKLRPTLQGLVYSTLLGGSFLDAAAAVAADRQRSVWVAGQTGSQDFPVHNPLGSKGSAFVAKLTAQGALAFSSRFGGSRWDFATSLALNADGDAYVGGETLSSDFPVTRGALKQTLDPSRLSDAFIAKITSSGDRVVFATYLGGSDGTTGPPDWNGVEQIRGLAVGGNGDVYVDGGTTSRDFPLVNPMPGTFPGEPPRASGFVARLKSDGSALVWSSYFGADQAAPMALVLDASENPALAGSAFSGFATFNAAQRIFGGGETDGFVAHIAQPLEVSVDRTPSSGGLPLGVSFASSVLGGAPPYTFDWDFGDGSGHSTQQNPTHTYTLGGMYVAKLTVTDSAGASASASVTITVTPLCTIACSASVPLAVSIFATGLSPVPFAASADVSSDCPFAPAFAWTFGDGATSTEQNPTHLYPAPGLYPWSLTTTVAGHACRRDGTILVTDLGSVDTLRIVPAVAHLEGFFGAQWRSELGLVNAEARATKVELVFASADTTIRRSATLAGGQTVAWDDVLVTLFGVNAQTRASGVVQIAADGRVAVAARTYSRGATGTFGQEFPALALGDGVGAGQVGIVPLVRKSAEFRSNLGLVALADHDCVVRVTLVDSDGTTLGQRDVEVKAGRWTQLDDVFAKLGSPARDQAYVRIEALTAGTRAWAYASVIDNRTNDPTTVPVVVP